MSDKVTLPSNWIPRKGLVEEAGTVTYNHRELTLQMTFGISCPRMFCFPSFQKYGPRIATDVLFSFVSLTFSQILLFQSGGEQLLKDIALESQGRRKGLDAAVFDLTLGITVKSEIINSGFRIGE